MNIEKARFNMIEQQIKPWYVFDEKLLGAMATLPREQFIPEEHRSLAYADIAIPLGHHQQMLIPRELARMIQALELKGHEKVLEIGCGSGYASAVLSKLAKKVYCVDIIPDFVKATNAHKQRLSIDNIVVEEVDASDGWLAHAPYDAILITSAIPKLTDGIKKSLNDNGRVVAILGTEQSQHVTICTLNENQDWHYDSLFPVVTETMINCEKPNQFEF